MTNHHCVHSCVEDLSTPTQDYIANDFSANVSSDEMKCPDLEVNQLIDIKDVTARVMKAAEGLTDAAANEAKKAEMARIEKECATTETLRCDIVPLYNGGIYDLYTFKDIRMSDLCLYPSSRSPFLVVTRTISCFPAVTSTLHSCASTRMESQQK